jgi:hypothetical protein
MAYKLYNYNPSGGAAIPAAALFGLATVIHIFQMIRARSWYMIPFTIGGVCKFSHDIREDPPGFFSKSSFSRGNRLLVQVHQFHRNTRLANHALYWTEPSYSSRSCPLCCIYLHDTWTSYCGFECEFQFNHSAVMVNENLRNRRSYFLLDAMWGYALLSLLGYSQT